MRLTPVFIGTLLTFFKWTSSQLVEIPDRGCVSSFQTSPGDFEICKTELCFVITHEKPYVFLDPAVAVAPFKPFLCRDHDKLYPKFRGLFFDVLHGISKRVPKASESRCIYGGRSCTFDDSVRFVGDVAKKEPSYRFVAGGNLLFIEHRRTPYTIHSQPITFNTMAVVIKPENARPSFPQAWRQVLQPFSIHGWLSMFCFGLIFVLGTVIHSLRFSRARTFPQFVRWFILRKPSERGVWETASWNSLMSAVVVFFAVLLLLYELSVVNFIIQGPDLLVDDISQLKTLGLENFAVVQGSASEAIFKYAVGWDRSRDKFPWVRSNSLEKSIELVKNKTARYAFTFEDPITNLLHSENLCNRLVAVVTDKNAVGGWYYSSSVPVELRASIDKAISILVLKQLPKQWRKAYGSSPLNCGKVTGAIGYEVLIILLGLTVCPFVLNHLISVALPYWRSAIEVQDADDVLNVVPAQVHDSNPKNHRSLGNL